MLRTSEFILDKLRAPKVYLPNFGFTIKNAEYGKEEPPFSLNHHLQQIQIFIEFFVPPEMEYSTHLSSNNFYTKQD